MITYDTLKDLAMVLSKMINCRYVAFHKSFSFNDDVFINFSDYKMVWHKADKIPHGFWVCDFKRSVLNSLEDLPDLDWSKCQFDCGEKEGEPKVHRMESI